jgi:hypothetical protein
VEAKQAGVEDPDTEFESRLANLKLVADQHRAESKSAQHAQQASILDSQPESIYANPPPLSQTLFGDGDVAAAGGGGQSSGLNNVRRGESLIQFLCLFWRPLTPAPPPPQFK